MKCPYCGAEMRDDAVLCVSCGRLTPEYERTYRRPDPTVGRGRSSDSRSYDPSVVRRAETTPSRPPRQLLLLVIGAIAALAVFSLFLGYLVPEQTTEEYRSAVDEEYIPDFYTETLDLYFAALSDDNQGQIRALHPKALRDEELEDWDALYDRYGEEVASYQILARSPHDLLETDEVEQQLDEDVVLYHSMDVVVVFEGDADPVPVTVDVVIIQSNVYIYAIAINDSL